MPVNGGVRQVNVIMNLGVADYDGLQTQFSYRGNRKMFASVSYTLSKATNTFEPDGNGIGPNESNITQLGEIERGPSVVDQRHRAVITFNYRFPFDFTAGTVSMFARRARSMRRQASTTTATALNNDRPVINGVVISKSAFRGTPTSDVAGVRGEAFQNVRAHELPAEAGRIQSFQSRKLSRARCDDLRRCGDGGADVWTVCWRCGDVDECDSGVCEHRPAADVPGAGTLYVF